MGVEKNAKMALYIYLVWVILRSLEICISTIFHYEYMFPQFRSGATIILTENSGERAELLYSLYWCKTDAIITYATWIVIHLKQRINRDWKHTRFTHIFTCRFLVRVLVLKPAKKWKCVWHHAPLISVLFLDLPLLHPLKSGHFIVLAVYVVGVCNLPIHFQPITYRGLS